ncbi:MAG TPA: hypothetical protein VEN12_00410 [Verrucomicrobiae bacterium]|nr:hypothetical protein [Verrucomicrobiae bacterium]
MSLRTDIHLAFDEIATSTYGMTERIVSAAMVDRPRSRARFPWSTRLRGVMSIAAVFVLVAMAVGVLAGGRLSRDLSTFVNRPAKTAVQALAALEARPLHLPVFDPGQGCPTSPSGIVPGLGAGNVRGFGSGPVIGMPVVYDSQSAWGTYGFQWLLVPRGMNGLVLGRGRDVVTGQALVFVGTFAAGAITGQDRDKNGIAVKQHQETLLDTDHPPEDTNSPEVSVAGGERYMTWQINVGLPAGASWCVAFQFDGPGFSEVFVVPSLASGPPA